MRFQICFLFCVVLLISSTFCLAQSTTLNRSAFVGAELGTLTNPVKVAYKMKVEKGIIIYKIFPNSAADKAGLIEKDVIIAIDSIHTNNLKEFEDIIKTKNGNDTLNLFFVRNDTVRNTPLVLQFLPRETNFYFETMYDKIELDSQNRLRTILTFPRNNLENSLDNTSENNLENSEPISQNNQQITTFPLVILLNSASNQSIEKELYSKNKRAKSEYEFYDWIENLTKNGFATLRIEKKGIGDSDGKLNEWTFEDEQKSIDAAFKKIKKQGSIHQQKIYLIALGSSSFVALENLIQDNLETKFQKIFIEKLPANLQKDKNQNADSLLLFFPELNFFDSTYSSKAILNLKKYDAVMENKKIVWIESKDDILRVLSRLRKEIE